MNGKTTYHVKRIFFLLYKRQFLFFDESVSRNKVELHAL